MWAMGLKNNAFENWGIFQILVRLSIIPWRRPSQLETQQNVFDKSMLLAMQKKVVYNRKIIINKNVTVF